VQGKNQRQVHQLLGFRVQGTCRVSLLEVIGVALARVKVSTAKLRHFSPHKHSNVSDNITTMDGGSPGKDTAIHAGADSSKESSIVR